MTSRGATCLRSRAPQPGARPGQPATDDDRPPRPATRDAILRPGHRFREALVLGLGGRMPTKQRPTTFVLGDGVGGDTRGVGHRAGATERHHRVPGSRVQPVSRHPQRGVSRRQQPRKQAGPVSASQCERRHAGPCDDPRRRLGSGDERGTDPSRAAVSRDGVGRCERHLPARAGVASAGCRRRLLVCVAVGRAQRGTIQLRHVAHRHLRELGGRPPGSDERDGATVNRARTRVRVW